LQDMFRFYHNGSPVMPNTSKFIAMVTFLPDRAFEVALAERQQRREEEEQIVPVQEDNVFSQSSTGSSSHECSPTSPRSPSVSPRVRPSVPSLSLKSYGGGVPFIIMMIILLKITLH